LAAPSAKDRRVKLQPDALREIALAGRVKRLPKGATVFEQGAPASRVFVLLQGRVKAAQSTSNGHLVTARFLKPGDPFGCVALMASGTYPVSAVAEVDCVVAGWDASSMVRFAYQYPQVTMNALRYVGAQLRDTQIRLQETMTEHIEQRIAHTLLRLVGQAGRRCADGIEINFPISRQDIAEIAGSRLFTVSRTLSKWQAEGIIKSGRRRIIVVAPHRLVMIAEKSPEH
jgi:CRP-like cAMP-binding protein